MTKPSGSKAKPRRRMEADVAQELILNATEKRLVVVGPSGIRLQEVAADAGVSHPTVLHHFGSRELLVKAVISRALKAINGALVDAIEASDGSEKQLEAMIENVGEALKSTGHARVITWLALEGHKIDGAEVRLTDVVDAAHALRLSRRPRDKKPSRDDTARIIVLATLTLIGSEVLGPTLIENAGLGSDEHAAAKFRSWLARLLVRQLDG